MPGAGGQGGPIMNVNTTDNRTGRRLMAAINPMTGGAGGRAERDGTDGSGGTQGFLKNTPIEINETEVPMRFHRYGLAQDSGGPGRHRGGLAHRDDVRGVRAEHARHRAQPRPHRVPGLGLSGGRPGANSAFWQNPGSNHALNLRNTDIVKIGPGDVISVRSGGAGGLAIRCERDPRPCCSTCAARSSRPRRRARTTAWSSTGRQVDAAGNGGAAARAGGRARRCRGAIRCSTMARPATA